MKKFRLFIFIAFSMASTAAWAERCLAIDGDTLVCNRQKVRLTNVYAAELNQAGGSAAKRRLQARVQGREVVLRAHGQDRYGRVLAGRGSAWGGERHQYIRFLRAKKPPSRAGFDRVAFASLPAPPSLYINTVWRLA